jgi:Lrp/AsnC family leucine-responsive transcriptional regulator
MSRRARTVVAFQDLTEKDHCVDEVDLAILKELQVDGQLSLVELGRRVRLTAAPVQRRLRALERDGWITGYVALIDPVRARRDFEAFLEIELADQSRGTLTLFEERVQLLPEVTECHRMSGRPDYLLKVVTHDVKYFNLFYLDQVLSLPGILRSKTHISLSRIKYTTALPLPRSVREYSEPSVNRHSAGPNHST